MTDQASSFQHSLYPMDTAFFHKLGYYPLETRCAIAAELGFADTYLTLWSPRAWQELEQLKTVPTEHGLGVAAVYLMVNTDEISSGQGIAQVEKVLEQLPEGTILEIAMPLGNDSELEKSDQSGDDAAVQFLQSVVEVAARSGHDLSLYPHVNFWLEHHRDAIRLCEKVNDPHLGMNFNVFHWFTLDHHNLEELLRDAKPHLKLATLNGSDKPNPKGSATLEPLDQGSLDLFAVLGALRREAGYRGKIGFQGYSWGGEPFAKLQSSLKYFRAMEDRLNRHPHWANLAQR
jgi:sugar phosphate isomerase/epimerase